jgi:hypothetical protein
MLALPRRCSHGQLHCLPCPPKTRFVPGWWGGRNKTRIQGKGNTYLITKQVLAYEHLGPGSKALSRSKQNHNKFAGAGK